MAVIGEIVKPSLLTACFYQNTGIATFTASDIYTAIIVSSAFNLSGSTAYPIGTTDEFCLKTSLPLICLTSVTATHITITAVITVQRPPAIVEIFDLPRYIKVLLAGGAQKSSAWKSDLMTSIYN